MQPRLVSRYIDFLMPVEIARSLIESLLRHVKFRPSRALQTLVVNYEQLVAGARGAPRRRRGTGTSGGRCFLTSGHEPVKKRGTDAEGQLRMRKYFQANDRTIGTGRLRTFWLPVNANSLAT